MKVSERQAISDKDASGLLSERIALKGDVSARLPIECSGLPRKLSEPLNGVIELSEPTAQLAPLRQVAAKQWKFKRRASFSENRGFRKVVDRDQPAGDLPGWLPR
jgi:hypothetical protein